MRLTTPVNLQHTLDSGQLFRYRQEGDGYRILHGRDAFFVRTDGRQLHFDGITQGRLARFFRLGDPYTSIISRLRSDTTLQMALQQYHGLRLLRQEPWECTVSFLCSSATNIPRIKRDIGMIAKTFGREKGGFFLFPRIGEIDSLARLKKCGTGFRAEYIHAVNTTVTKAFFRKLMRLAYEDAKAALMELPGIGPKVADCILLFSLEKLNAFPIDTWTERALREHYLRKPKATHRELTAFAQRHFAPYAGYAQQFLYHWIRHEK